jgi:hypothetical protein
MYGDGGSKIMYDVAIEFHVGNIASRCLRTVTKQDEVIFGVIRIRVQLIRRQICAHPDLNRAFIRVYM